MDSELIMVTLSLGVLIVMAAGALAPAIRAFNRKTMA
jgi:hypothetical protein